MPVLKAKGEAEALCAQLDREGRVDACITSDSDAFLYGAKCVIKCIRPNNKVSNGSTLYTIYIICGRSKFIVCILTQNQFFPVMLGLFSSLSRYIFS